MVEQSVIEVQDLRRSFAKRPVLKGVSFKMAEGKVLGLVGENGAGKTTLIRHLLGMYAPEQGSIKVFGHVPAAEPELVLDKIGYLSEAREMPDWMTLPQLCGYTRAFFADWDDAYADELRLAFNLPSNQKVKSFSRGQRARMGLLLALAHRPRLLILDEPSSGLDSIVRRDILTAIIRTVAEEGRSVLFSSHLLGEVERVADEVMILHDGKIQAHAPLTELCAEHGESLEQVFARYAGKGAVA